jgi:hypothetical protein
MSLTQEGLQEIANFNAAANSKFTGLLMDDSPGGRANANSIISHLYGQGLPLTVANLDAAVVSLQYVLFWSKGNEPIVAPSDNRTRAQKAADGGINPYVREGTHADTSERSFARDVREGREKHVADNIRRERDALRYKETHQTVLSPNGRTNYAESNRLNDEARKRHAEEDTRESGKPVQVTGFRVIPDNGTNFRGPAEAPYTPAELSAYLARRKGRPGEPTGSLLR